MDYRESLAYLYGLQRFGIKLGLENTLGLLASLSNPERDIAIVHVGGSNGKGSVSATMASIAQQSGLRVGLYTSPHLHSFTERIQVNGLPIAEQEVARLTGLIRSRCQGIPATFFEFTTVLALLYFQQLRVDLAVLEVGMGGRLDATNVVQPKVAIITPICRDHAEHLGPDLATIAGEKGGIIKTGVPLIIGLQSPEALSVLQRQAENFAAPTFVAGRDFSIASVPTGWAYQGLDLSLSGLHLGLPGAHQGQNISLALAACEILRRQGFPLPVEALRKGVATVRWPGRLEWWKDEEVVLLDGAHNEGGALVLAAYLSSLQVKGIRWVAGVKARKEIHDILAPLLPLVNSVYAAPPPVDEPIHPDELILLAGGAGVPARSFNSVANAMSAALAERCSGEIVLVAGSLFLVAAAREYLMNREESGS